MAIIILMALIILRIVFLMVASAVGIRLIQTGLLAGNNAWLPWLGFGGVMLLAVMVIIGDVLVRRKRLDTISAIYFGMIIGLFLTYVLKLALTPVLAEPEGEIAQWSMLALGMVLCYTCISVLIQTKNDFRFIIPYVEFAKEVKGLKPFLLDTSVVIDGRIADLIETSVLDNQLVMPRFIINELQAIADSTDKLRRSRGRRGLDIMNRLRNDPNVDLMIYDRELPEGAGQPVDMKLVLLAKKLDGKIVTNDYNLNKVSKLHGVGVINLNDIANSLKPIFLPGEDIKVRVIKKGEESGQGVGYLEDGTMVVIEGGRDHIGEEVNINVTSVLQTSAGRMVFGRYQSGPPAAEKQME